MKIFFFDTETTGLDPISQDIISLSYIIEIDHTVVLYNSFFIQPIDESTINEDALTINGITRDQFPFFLHPHDAYQQLISDTSKVVDRYNPDDKFYPCAYRADFDYSFLKSFFTKLHDQYFGSWFNSYLLDPLPFLRFLTYQNLLPVQNHKLKTISEYFHLPHDAHTSMSDTIVLRHIWHFIESVFSLNRKEFDETFLTFIRGFENPHS